LEEGIFSALSDMSRWTSKDMLLDFLLHNPSLLRKSAAAFDTCQKEAQNAPQALSKDKETPGAVPRTRTVRRSVWDNGPVYRDFNGNTYYAKTEHIIEVEIPDGE